MYFPALRKEDLDFCTRIDLYLTVEEQNRLQSILEHCKLESIEKMSMMTNLNNNFYQFGNFESKLFQLISHQKQDVCNPETLKEAIEVAYKSIHYTVRYDLDLWIQLSYLLESFMRETPHTQSLSGLFLKLLMTIKNRQNTSINIDLLINEISQLKNLSPDLYFQLLTMLIRFEDFPREISFQLQSIFQTFLNKIDEVKEMDYSTNKQAKHVIKFVAFASQLLRQLDQDECEKIFLDIFIQNIDFVKMIFSQGRKIGGNNSLERCLAIVLKRKAYDTALCIIKTCLVSLSYPTHNFRIMYASINDPKWMQILAHNFLIPEQEDFIQNYLLGYRHTAKFLSEMILFQVTFSCERIVQFLSLISFIPNIKIFFQEDNQLKSLVIEIVQKYYSDEQFNQIIILLQQEN